MVANPNWTFEEAQAEHARVLALDPSRASADPTLPFFQWAALQDLKQLEEMFNRGNGGALMRAICECARCDLPLPDWAANAYLRAYYKVVGCEEKSWDAVFGKPYRKGINLNALKKKRELKFEVFNTIIGVVKRDPGTAIDSQLFEEVGKKFNIGKTLAEEYYREACEILEFSAVDVKKRQRE